MPFRMTACLPASSLPLTEDVPPPGRLSCQEQRAWGMCTTLAPAGYCTASCGECAGTSIGAVAYASSTSSLASNDTAITDAGSSDADGLCDDIPTPDGTSCSQVIGRQGGDCRGWRSCLPASSSPTLLSQHVKLAVPCRAWCRVLRSALLRHALPYCAAIAAVH